MSSCVVSISGGGLKLKIDMNIHLKDAVSKGVKVWRGGRCLHV